MSAAKSKPMIVHMVGSIPVDDAETAFRTVGGALGKNLERVPDGETGRRRRWISFIADQLKEHPDFEVDSGVPPFEFRQWDGKVVFTIERRTFKKDVDPAKVVFNTGYSDDAIRNFEIFDRLQRHDAIPKHLKYQICSATPHAIALMFVSPRVREIFLEIYSNHLLGEVRRIMEALPHDRISYQWDVCQEVLLWEGYLEQYPGFKEEVLVMLGRVGNAVPDDVDVGYHLCYGSPADEHMVQPKDMGILVELGNGIMSHVRRTVRYVHMPVPRDRNDDGYFRPLKELELHAGTDLYLGLVHANDSEGNARKLALARKFALVSGVSAECGLGRGKPERLPEVLEQHRRLAEGG